MPSTLQTPHGDATQISVNDYLQDVLISLPPHIDLTRIIENLKTRRSITSNGRWRGFPTDPAVSYFHEKDSFRHLSTVIQSIIKASGSHQSSPSFHLNPLRLMSSLLRKHDEEYLPDAYLSLGSARDWSDIWVFGELKKEDSESDITDDIAKVTASMARCLHMDPKRRSMFAFTIENTNMKFWFCDRSQLLVSESFNFITNHEPLVHFIVSLIFATPTQRGLDPTMTVLENSRGYDITVQPEGGRTRTYRTLELLSKQDVVLGKGTRVWKVVEICDGKETGPPKVLKDCWVEPERTPEGVIYERMLADVSTSQASTEDPPFLTIECHGDVYLDQNSREVLDCTRALNSQGGSANTTVTSRAGLVPEDTEIDGLCKRLVHYRVIFGEVCKSLSDERSLPVIFQTLSEAALALKQLHAAGWVHRDVSIDNIFITDEGKTLLGDFEYAKTLGTEDESRVGTAYFMAVEAEAQKYLFREVIPPPASPLKKKYPDMVPRIERFEERHRAKMAKRPRYRALRTPPPEEPNPPFRYNPLHDLESIWWIAAYFVLKKEIVGELAGFPIASSAQRSTAAELFRYGQNRQDPWLNHGSVEQISQCLPPVSRHLAEDLNDLRAELFCRYFVEELELGSIDHTCADCMHDECSTLFMSIANHEPFQDLKVRSFTYVEDPAPVDGDYGYNEDHWSVPSPYRTKRRRSITPSDTSIDYSQFKKAKMVRAVDPEQAGVPSRSRLFLARKAKRPVRGMMVGSHFVRF